jgi:hypothetical protein
LFLVDFYFDTIYIMAIQTRKMKLTVWFLLASSAAAFAPSRPVAFRSVALAAEKKAGLRDSFKRFLGGNTEKDSTVAVVEETVVEETAMKIEETVEADAVEETTKPGGFDQIKAAGKAGAISLFLWEGAFWVISVPVVTVAYRQATGHFPDFTNKDDLAKLGAEAFAFANVARFALPLRIALALGTIPWCQDNIVDRFWPEEGDAEMKP